MSIFHIKNNILESCICNNSVTIPDGVRVISENVFKNSIIESITFPNTIEYINKDAFSGCIYLTSVIFPPSLKTIGENAFKGCNLKYIHFSECKNLISIGNNAFYNIPTISHIHLYSCNNLISIGEYAFSRCPITSLTLPDTIETIGDFAFANCNISSVRFTTCKHIKYIGNAFDTSVSYYYLLYDNNTINGCILHNTNHVTIPEGVEHISKNAFINCDITSITFPSSLKIIDEDAFLICGITTFNFDVCKYIEIENNSFSEDVILFSLLYSEDKTSVTRYHSISNKRINNSIHGMFSERLFSNPIKYITIPEGVTTIKQGAFIGSGLIYVNLPRTIVSIETGAFSNDVSYALLIYSDNKTVTGCELHMGYSSPQNESFNFDIIVPDGVETIADNAFINSKLTSIIFPASLKTIGKNAFLGCIYLTSVNVSACIHLQSIGDNAFKDCPFTSINLFLCDNIRSIGISAFESCHFNSIDLSVCYHLTSIPNSVFYNSELSSIYFPIAIQSIDDSVFFNCKITSVIFPDTLESIGSYTFKGCPLSSVTFSKSLTTIGNSAFYNCPLTSITLPTNLKSIGEDAFNYTLLNYKNDPFIIPRFVTHIGIHAFRVTLVMNVNIPVNMVTYVNTAQLDPTTAIFPDRYSINSYGNVKINFNVTLDTDSKINIFGEPLDIPLNVIIANYALPVDALYDDINYCGLIEMVDNGNDIDVKLANSNINTYNLTDAYKKSAIKLVYALERVLCDSFDGINADPFSDYKEEEKYTTQSDFGRLSLNCFAHYLMGHIDAALAITNDVSFMEKMLSLSDASVAVKDSTLLGKYGVSTALSTSGPSRFKKTNITVTDSSTIIDTVQDDTNARLAELLVRSILEKGLDNNGLITSTIQNGVAPEHSSLAHIVAQVISQDLNRAMGKNNRYPVLLPFYPGDIIYMNIKLKRPTITVGNGFNEDIKNRYTKEINYAIQITLGPSSNINPVNDKPGDNWIDTFKDILKGRTYSP